MTLPLAPIYRDNASDAPRLLLHSADAVGIATLLGSPLGGALLLALNERALGRARRAWAVVGAGVFATACLVALGLLLPRLSSGVGVGINIGLALGARTLARHWLARANAEGRLGDVQWRSKWRAVGAGLVALLLAFAAITVIVAVGPDSLQDRVEVRPGMHVYYAEGATADEARRVGAQLNAIPSFSRANVDLQYARTARGHALSFLIPERDYASDPALPTELRAVGRYLQPRTDPRGALELRVCDGDFRPHHTLTFPEPSSP